MDQEQPHSSDQSSAKRQKRNDENDVGESSAVVAVDPTPAVNIQQTGDIFKLDIDCFEEAFDYLPFRDLVSVGKTCKRLQQVAGYCLQQNYSGKEVCYSSTGIEVYDNFSNSYLNFTHFAPFIQKISIFYTRELQPFHNTPSKFHRLKEIIMRSDFAWAKISRFVTKAIWSKLEALYMDGCDLGSNFHEILNLCPKLKRLEIHYCKGEFNWFDRKYPTLEYLKIEISLYEPIEDVPKFLELNPTIRKFATTGALLCENHNPFLTANIKLDELAIYLDWRMGSEFQSMCDLLNELHNRGFYGKLQLYFWSLSQEMINKIATVNGLNKLGTYSIYGDIQYLSDQISLSSLKNLEEIYLRNGDRVADLEMLPNELIDLKRIRFKYASINQITPFMKKSVEMQRIKVERLEGGVYFNKDTKLVDLRALNREREQLSDAQKITLYVEEDVYLATKWALGETDFALIRLKRDTSFEWEHDFQEFE